MIANTISIILFFLSATMVFLRYCLSRRISSYLIAEDIKHTNGIVQHQFGWISTMVCVLPAAISISISLIKNGDYFFYVDANTSCVSFAQKKHSHCIIRQRQYCHQRPQKNTYISDFKCTNC